MGSFFLPAAGHFFDCFYSKSRILTDFSFLPQFEKKVFVLFVFFCPPQAKKCGVFFLLSKTFKKHCQLGRRFLFESAVRSVYIKIRGKTFVCDSCVFGFLDAWLVGAARNNVLALLFWKICQAEICPLWMLSNQDYIFVLSMSFTA